MILYHKKRWLSNFLARRGFDWEVIKEILDQLTFAEGESKN